MTKTQLFTAAWNTARAAAARFGGKARQFFALSLKAAHASATGLTLAQAVDAIKALPGVTGAKLWARIVGKERIYIDTVKCNGGRGWNAGVGYQGLWAGVDGSLNEGREAGTATRDHHAALGTLDAIRSIVARIA